MPCDKMIFKKGVLGKKIDETHKTEHVSKGIVLEMGKKKKKREGLWCYEQVIVGNCQSKYVEKKKMMIACNHSL